MQLMVKNVINGQGDIYSVTSPGMSIGSASYNDIILQNTSSNVCSVQAIIKFTEDNQCILINLSRKFSMLVNDKNLMLTQERAIASDDKIVIGDYELTFVKNTETVQVQELPLHQASEKIVTLTNNPQQETLQGNVENPEKTEKTLNIEKFDNVNDENVFKDFFDAPGVRPVGDWNDIEK